MDRRSFIGVCATSLGTTVAGCRTLGTVTETAEGGHTIVPTESELTASEFRTFVSESHDRHGSGGVWGRRGDQPHDLAFEGAWTEAFSHGDGTESRHLLVMYQLPPGPGRLDSSQVWLWSGIDPPEGLTVHRLETGISLSSDAALGIYSPGQGFSAEDVEDYPVESGRLDVPTEEVRMPLSSGRIGIGEDTQVGDGGAYVPFWEGESDSVQSIAATAEVRWQDRQTGQLEWESSVETS